jgi:hypothetical protein
MFKRNFLAKTILLCLILMASGCKSDDPPQIGAPQKAVSTQTNENEGDDTNKGVDIIVPEVVVDNDQYQSKSIFDLFDLFFKSFVSVVDDKPFDTRVNFKSMHQLRTNRDRDFLNLVSIIEKRMANYAYLNEDKDTQAAFLLNVYNYAALRMANKGYVKEDNKMITSLRDLSKIFYKGEIEIRDTITLSDGVKSLSSILKNHIKPLFSENGDVKDARFYFLANGAALGRAPLLNQAIFPQDLEKQLNFATKNTIELKRYVDMKGDDLEVARFFKWYKEDFETAYGSLEEFFVGQGLERSSFDRIAYKDADYDLNDLAQFTGPVLSEAQQPLPPIETGEDIIPTKPCDYLKSEKVEVLAYCNQVIDGTEDGFYKYENEVIESKLCLYTRDLGDGEKSLGINGNIVETNPEASNRNSLSIAVEDKLKIREDKLRIRIAEGVRTTLEYLQTDRRLMFRQTSVIPGKGYRKALLQCE